MTIPTWQFLERPARAEDYSENDTTEQLFAGPTADRTELAVSLVRETIQNALDARLDDNSQVKVRFTLSSKALNNKRAEYWTNGLEYHLGQVQASSGTQKILPEISEFITKNRVQSGLNYLLVEDFNTHGLVGATDRVIRSNSEDVKDENWHYFMFAKGKTNKGAGMQGSWGYGKTVCHAASGSHCFIALTQRDTDKRELVMGKTRLYSHQLESGNDSFPEGYFALPTRDFDSLKPWQPAENTEVIDRFKKDFGVVRESGVEPGTSIAILWPKFEKSSHEEEQITFDKILSAATYSFIYPLVEQKLEVEVVENGRKPVTVNSETIEQVIAEEIEWDETGENSRDYILKFFNMIWLQRTSNSEERLELKLPIEYQKDAGKTPGRGAGRTAMYREMISPHAEFIRNKLSRQATEDSAVVLRVPVEMYDDLDEGDPNWQTSYFDVVLRKNDQSDEEGGDYYVRDYLTISGMDRIKSRKGYMAFVYVSSGSWSDGSDPMGSPRLSEMLRLSEPPAHTEWQPDSKYVAHFRNADSRIRFVNAAASDIISIIEEKEKKPGMWQNKLAGVFGVASDEEGTDVRTPTKPRGPVISRQNNWVVEPRSDGNGVAVRFSPNEKSVMPDSILLEVHTQIEKPNGIGKYHDSLDFDFIDDLGEVKMESSDCVFEVVKPNAIQLSELNEGFAFELSGLNESWDYVFTTSVV
ncbi:MAG: hypothetical protein CMJ72_15910 [Planctomycetaceae bacterium]|nr:hypothetical protein [Planctomycetaceae bacterium]